MTLTKLLRNDFGAAMLSMAAAGCGGDEIHYHINSEGDNSTVPSCEAAISQIFSCGYFDHEDQDYTEDGEESFRRGYIDQCYKTNNEKRAPWVSCFSESSCSEIWDGKCEKYAIEH